MEGIITILFFMNLAALILSIKAIRKTKRTDKWIEQLVISRHKNSDPKKQPLPNKIEQAEINKEPVLDITQKTVPSSANKATAVSISPDAVRETAAISEKTITKLSMPKPLPLTDGIKTPSQASMEQIIGTKWIPIAGIILLIFGAGFFLKFAYENFSISPVYRVILVASCGLAALAAGEITRRRQYEIVAKSVTSLGFGLLYASIFAAYGYYHIISAWPALTAGVIITALAMLYAVVLNEIVMAFLSLLGGYLTPILISTNEYLPVPLFGYLLALAIGAMQCAYYRKWRVINFISFAGTFVLYTLWYEKFYGFRFTELSYPSEMPAALTALSIFFVVFLTVPLLNGLKNKTKAIREDVLLILANAGVTLYYLYMILNPISQTALAWATLIMAALHLGMMFAVRFRVENDSNLQAVLLTISLTFATLAMPLFFSMNILSIAWAAESATVTFIGIRYRSRITQIGGISALILCCTNLIYYLPMHETSFRPVLNLEFGVWCFAALSAYFNHLFYRMAGRKPDQTFGLLAQSLYVLMGILLITASGIEWFSHCRFNLVTNSLYIMIKGPLPILTGGLLLFIIRPICPAGKIRGAFSILLTATGIWTLLPSLILMHRGDFTPFFNTDILPAYAFIVAIIIYHLLCRFIYSDSKKFSEKLYAITVLLLLLTAVAEWALYCCSKETVYLVPMSILLFKGITVILSAALLASILRPLSPLGNTCKSLAIIIGCMITLYTIGIYTFLHKEAFRIFVNAPFLFTLMTVAALIISAILTTKAYDREKKSNKTGNFLAFTAIFIPWIIITMEIYLYWFCLNKYESPMAYWQFKAYMFISIMWAIYASVMMIAGFIMRLPLLRYIALGLFGLLLAKVFIIDTSQVQNVYRIAAFIATGGVLVGISYLYQFLKKKNFFEALPTIDSLNAKDN